MRPVVLDEMIKDGKKLSQYMWRTGREKGLGGGQNSNIDALVSVRTTIRREKQGIIGVPDKPGVPSPGAKMRHLPVFKENTGFTDEFSSWATEAGLSNVDPQYARDALWLYEAKRVGLDPDALMRKYPDSFAAMKVPEAVAPTEAIPAVRGAVESVEPGRPTFSVITPEQQAGFPPRIPPTRRPVSGGRFDDAMRRSDEQISLKEPKEPLITQARRGIPFLQQTVFDDLYPLGRFTAAAKKGGAALSTAENPYLVARLLKGVGGKINTFIETGTCGKRNWKIVDGQTVPDF